MIRSCLFVTEFLIFGGLFHQASNNLIGELPPEISALSTLDNLLLGGNCLYGSLPPEMFELNLTGLDVSWNYLSGSVPEELYELKSLVSWG